VMDHDITIEVTYTTSMLQCAMVHFHAFTVYMRCLRKPMQFHASIVQQCRSIVLLGIQHEHRIFRPTVRCGTLVLLPSLSLGRCDPRAATASTRRRCFRVPLVVPELFLSLGQYLTRHW